MDRQGTVFDPRRGAKFGTYAAIWIIQAICKEVPPLDRVVRIPEYQARRQQRMARSIRELTQRLGRSPTIREIAVEMDVAVEKVTDALSHIPEQVDSGKPSDGMEGPGLLETLCDTDATTPFEDVAQQELVDRLRRTLTSLSPRHRKVLRLHYGLDERDPHTLREIGTKMHLSRERVRQIEVEAMNALRSGLTRPQRRGSGHRMGKSRKTA